ARADFLRLAALAHEEFADAGDFESAMAWARTFHTRQEEYFQNHRAFLSAVGAPDRDALGEIGLPPACEMTLHWLLYRYVGLNDASRKAALERGKDLLPAQDFANVLAWGRNLERQRRASSEPLPPSSDSVAVLCALERLTGTDAYGLKCRRLVP